MRHMSLKGARCAFNAVVLVPAIMTAILNAVAVSVPVERESKRGIREQQKSVSADTQMPVTG